MYPFRTGNRVAFQKDQDSILRRHATDIERLWRLQQQVSEGQPVGGTGTFAPTIDEWEGVLTATLTAPTNGWVTPTTVTASQYIVDPASTTHPTGMISGGPTFTLINRDKSLSGPSGTYCRWRLIVLSDGTSEYRISWIAC